MEDARLKNAELANIVWICQSMEGAGTMKQRCVLRTCLNKVVKKHNFGVSRRGRKKVNKNVRETDRDATTELTETGVNGVDGMDLYRDTANGGGLGEFDMNLTNSPMYYDGTFYNENETKARKLILELETLLGGNQCQPGDGLIQTSHTGGQSITSWTDSSNNNKISSDENYIEACMSQDPVVLDWWRQVCSVYGQIKYRSVSLL